MWKRPLRLRWQHRTNGEPSDTTRLRGWPAPIARRFVAAAGYLRHCGLKSPDIYAADAAHGFLLIEDLGTDLYTDIIERDGGEHALYETAIDALVTLHELPAPASLSPEKPLFVYDEAAMLAEIDLLTEWFFPLAVGRHPGECETQEHRALWRECWELPMDRRYSSIATITRRIYCGADRSPVSTGSASSIFRTLWPDRRPMTSFRCWRMPARRLAGIGRSNDKALSGAKPAYRECRGSRAFPGRRSRIGGSAQCQDRRNFCTARHTRRKAALPRSYSACVALSRT